MCVLVRARLLLVRRVVPASLPSRLAVLNIPVHNTNTRKAPCRKCSSHSTWFPESNQILFGSPWGAHWLAWLRLTMGPAYISTWVSSGCGSFRGSDGMPTLFYHSMYPSWYYGAQRAKGRKTRSVQYGRRSLVPPLLLTTLVYCPGSPAGGGCLFFHCHAPSPETSWLGPRAYWSCNDGRQGFPPISGPISVLGR